MAHVITAVGSRSVDSAQDFIDRLKKATSSESWSWGVKQGKLDRCKAYGTYEAVYNDEVRSAVARWQRRLRIMSLERRRRLRWHATHTSSPQHQGCPPSGKACLVREAVHPRPGGARRADRIGRREEMFLNGVGIAKYCWNVGITHRLPYRAVWTRFHPLSYAVQELLRSGELGRPRRFAADFSMDFKPDCQPSFQYLVSCPRC